MANQKQKKVFVGLSGGVDSSVAAFLLKKRGYQVVGCFIKGYNLDGCAEKDAQDARRVAEHLKIPFYVFDLEKEYKEKVVDYMINGYKKGLTPNPDVMCNKEIKFGLFLKKALEMGADFIATGHYVRQKLENGNWKLEMARDSAKDQSYFLWTLTQEQLKHCLFPIGNYLKSEVRQIAKKAGLPTAEKKDSQGICFLGQVNLLEFLQKHLPLKKGKILTVEGKKIGEHNGAYFYTIGQRHLKISNIKNQKPKNLPFYVAQKDIKTNTLIVAEGSENPALFKKEIKLIDLNFIVPQTEILALGFKQKREWKVPVMARVRYRQPLAPATLYFSKNKKIAKLIFDHPQKFVAPGQSAVFYKKERSFFQMLGGGVIF